MARFGEINAQYFDDAGAPLGSGKLYFYESGTTTPKNTFSDINLTIPNTNPVILTAAGRQPNIFFNGNAKGILADKNDVQILVRDPIGETGTNFGDAWVATTIYSANSVVIGSDGVYYRSLANGNQNNNPTTTSGFWTLLYSVDWNAGITYKVGAVVTYEGNTYQSLQNGNINQNPASVTAYWVPLAFAWLATRTYAIHENVVGTDGILYTSLQNSNLNKVPASSGAYWVGTSAAAAASATAAASSATAAATSATASATSATASATSATASDTARAAAVVAKDAAVVAKDAAVVAKTAAETAETNAETAETNAASSATAAASSASGASGSATAAASSATAAASSATAASSSQTAAASSATAAAASATTATTKASEAATSATNAATSASTATTKASEAATSATNAATSATAAAGSATSAATSATAAAASLDEFTDLYLGAKSSAPTVDNDGNALQAGALYFNTVSDTMFVYSGSSWAAAGSAVNGTAERKEYIATSNQTTFSATYDVGFVDVYLNGSKLTPTADFAATNGATVVLTTGATTGDNVSIIAYGAFNVANVYTQAQSNARYTQIANNLSDLASAPTALTNLGLTATAAELNYTDGVTSNIQTQLDAAGVGSVTSVGGTGSVSGLTLTGTVTSSGNLTLGGTLNDINLASGVTGTLPAANGGTGLTAAGTSGNVLTSTGSGWASTAPAAGGSWTYISTTDITSSVASVEITSGITSAYDMYALQLIRVEPSATGGYKLYMRVSSNGGNSYASGGSDYGASTYTVGSSGSVQGWGVAGEAFMSFADSGMGNNAGENMTGTLYMVLPSDSNRTTFFWDMAQMTYSSYQIKRIAGAGKYNVATAINALQFFMSDSGSSLIGGKIRLYGINNS